MQKTISISMVFMALLLLAMASMVMAGKYSIPLRHSDEGQDLRVCTKCHEDGEKSDFPYRKFNHTLFYGDTHGATARQNQSVCAMCHRPAECSACHGAGIGLKPSLKKHTDPRPRTPHRGDYLTRHRIEGKINPTKCFRCHGRPKTAKSCAPCHG